MCVDWVATATNQEQAIFLVTWLKMRFRGHLIHPQSPTFCGFHPSELPKRTPRPRPFLMLRQVSLNCFELVVAHFGPPKTPKCLENGLFWDQKWVKNGSKIACFQTSS